MENVSTTNSDDTSFRILSSADLEDHRPRIEELYIKENLMLKDVARVIRDETGIDVSISMYKKKIARWGLRKGHFHWQKDKVQVRPNAPQGAHEGVIEPSTITREGMGASVPDRRSQRRRGRGRIITAPDQIARNQANKPDAAAWQLHTSPNAIDPYQWNEQLIKLTYDLQCQLMEPLVLPVGVFDTPSENDHTDSPVVLRRREISKYFPIEHDFRGTFYTAIMLIDEKKFQAAGAALERGFRTVGPLLKHLTPAIVPSLLILLHGIPYYYKIHRVSRMIARYLFHYTWQVFGPSSPLALWCRALAFHTYTSNSLPNALLAASTATSLTAGPYDNWSLTIRAGVLESNTGFQDLPMEEIISRHESLLNDIKLLYPPKLRLELKTRQSLATILSERGKDHVRAENLISDVAELIHHTYPNEMDNFSVLAASDDLANFIMEQGHTPHNIMRAEKIRREALVRSRELFGREHVLTTLLAKQLGKLYEEAGRKEEADEQYRAMLETLEKFKLGENEEEEMRRERDEANRRRERDQEDGG